MPQKIFLGCDHGGFPLKQKILSHFTEMEFVDFGTNSDDSVDYPDYAKKVCKALEKEPEALGLLICGSGQGMAMTANKFAHIRAALCWSEKVAQLAREHNNANVLCLGARVLDEGLALRIFKVFLEASFEGGRHERRVEKIKGVCCD